MHIHMALLLIWTCIVRVPAASPSAQSQPPGFSGLPPPMPAPVTPALAQMLTQSAALQLSNLQMMQLKWVTGAAPLCRGLWRDSLVSG